MANTLTTEQDTSGATLGVHTHTSEPLGVRARRASAQVRQYLKSHANERLQDPSRVRAELSALVQSAARLEEGDVEVVLELPSRWAHVILPESANIAVVVDHLCDTGIYWVRPWHRNPEPHTGHVEIPVRLTFLVVQDLQQCVSEKAVENEEVR